MAQTNVTFRMDEDLKKQAEALFHELGMNLTTAYTIFTKAALRYHGLPFEVSADPFYGQSNRQAIDESVEQLRQGKTVVKTIEELEAMENV